MRTIGLIVGASLSVGCGPAVELDGGGGDASTTSTTSTTTPAVTSEGPTMPPMTSVGPTTLDGSSTAMASVGFIEPTGGGCGETEDGGGSFECDSWVQDCCPGDKCVPWANDGGNSWNASRCVPIVPDGGGPGETCTVEGSGVSGIDDCDATSICWDVDPRTLMGECVAQCLGDVTDPLCPDGTGCMIANDGTLHLCLQRCDPTDPAPCDDGEVCAFTEDDFLCTSSPIGKTKPGSPCEDQFWCLPDLWCVDAADFSGCMSPGCCSPYCDLDSPVGDAPCVAISMEMQCVPIFGPGEAPDGLEHVGACQIP